MRDARRQNCLSQLLLVLYLTQTATPDSSIEMAIIDDSSTLSLRVTMPLHLKMTIKLLSGYKEHPVNLTLSMNKELNEQRTIYVPREDSNGSTILVTQNVPIDGNIAFYQDKITGAAVKMTCVGLSLGVCDMSLEGSFYYDNVEYGLTPMTSRDKRSIGTRRKKFYSVHKVKRAEPSVYDYKDTGPTLDTNISLKETALNNPRLTGMPMRRQLSEVISQQKPPFKKHFKMGLIVIVDFSIYQRWYRMSNMLTPAQKDMDAKFKIRQYLAHVINGVDLRYNTLTNFEISIVVTSYIIADRESVSVWTTNRYKSESRDLLYADDALNKLVQWRYYMEQELPVHDHTMLFTGHDLYRPSIENTGVAGFARVRSMCTPLSVSVVEDHGGFSSILTATHELGHSLGALHDGHNNTCSGQDNFIMTPIGGGSSSNSNAANPFRFSPCSETAFEKFLKSLSPGHCLTDEPEVYDIAEFQRHMQTEAGQIYGPNDQCIQHLGSHSYYAWGGVLGEISEICTHMACKNHQSSSSFNIYYAARGTSCGNKKWCIEGVCTPSPSAPHANDECVHGDSWRRFGNMTCAQYVNNDPSRCYYSFYSKFCCIACAKLKKKLKGCEYGDRKKACKTYIQSQSDCYDDNNDKICCGTCHRFQTGITGCEYGDRLPECEATKCDNAEYSKQCCATCTSRSRHSTVKRPANKVRPPPPPKRTPSKPPITLSPLFAITPKPPKRQPLFPELRVGTVSTKSRGIKQGNKQPHQERTKSLNGVLRVSKGFPRSSSRPAHDRRNISTKKQGHSPKFKNKRLRAQNRNTKNSKQRIQRNNNKLQTIKNKTNVRKAKQTKTKGIGIKKVVKKHRKHSLRGRIGNEIKRHKKSSNVNLQNSKTPTTGQKSRIPNKKNMKRQIETKVDQGGWKKCLKRDAKLFGVSCAKYSETICSIALLGGMCCEICQSQTLTNADCRDNAECSTTRGFDCYREEKHNRCCSTCKKFNTGIPGCEYGDKIQICAILIRIARDSTCRIASQNCCYSCLDSNSQNQKVPNNGHFTAVNANRNLQNRNNALVLPLRNSFQTPAVTESRQSNQIRRNGLFSPLNNVFVSSQSNDLGRISNVRRVLPWNSNLFLSPTQSGVQPTDNWLLQSTKTSATPKTKKDKLPATSIKRPHSNDKARKNEKLQSKGSSLGTTRIGIGDINILQTINFYNNAQNRGLTSGVNSPKSDSSNFQNTNNQQSNSNLNSALLRLLMPVVPNSLPLQRVVLPSGPQHKQSSSFLWLS